MIPSSPTPAVGARGNVFLITKDFIGEFEFADFLSAEIDYIDVCHRSSLFAPAIDAADKNFV